MSFPENFTWGAAAASYQIEGAAYADGKGLSVWDMMCRQPGKIDLSDHGEVACDHYHRYSEDISLMAEIGLQAYRLSISWPRVLPDGVGRINDKGLAFYDRLIDALLEKHIQPWVTLFHWDLPYALFARGGWLNRDSADWFAEYTGIVVDRLSDRVCNWITKNEPQCYIGLGHQNGEHAPGLRLGFTEVLVAAHHALLAHGKAVQIIRARAKSPARVGAAPVGVVKIPATGSDRDIAAARSAMFSISARDVWNNSWFADPMILGRYPEDGLNLFADCLPEIRQSDLQTIHQPLDFYGVNIYHGDVVRASDGGGTEQQPATPGCARTTMGWPVSPQALYWGPKFLYERYRLPIAITENGMANPDWVQDDGRVQDPQRIDFLSRYLRELHKAVADGVSVDAYFQWSVMDNFEWAFGFSKRFGLIHIDYKTQRRTLKDSAYWYRNVIQTNGDALL